MEQITDADLDRLGRAAEADLGRFFERNPHLHALHDRLIAVALPQGAAEHPLRGPRGVWGLDGIVGFDGPRAEPLRRPVRHLGWGPAECGRGPHAPPEYTGRAVDVKYWVIPGASDAVAALRSWLEARLKAAPDPARSPDLAHEPVILIRPDDRFGEVVWDPQFAPPAKRSTTK